MNLEHNPYLPIPESKIEAIQFYIVGDQDNIKNSCVDVKTPDIIKSGDPVTDGIYDLNLGTTDAKIVCKTCGNNNNICPGHFGSLKLRYPVKNPMFIEELAKWLNVMCHNCGEFHSPIKVNKKKASKITLTMLYKNTKKDGVCEHCEHKIRKVVKDPMSSVILRYKDATKGTLGHEIMNHHIQSIIDKIRPDQIAYVNKRPETGPKLLILNTINITPTTIRPDVKIIGGNRNNNNDITTLTKQVVEQNLLLPPSIPQEDVLQKSQNLINDYNVLDNLYFDLVIGASATSNKVKTMSNNNVQLTALGRIPPGKYGLIRHRILGARCRNAARAVISCDIRINPQCVGIPLRICQGLQIPEIVNEHNIDELQIQFNNGTKNYPGAKKVKTVGTSSFKDVDYMKGYKLQIGDIIYRDLKDGDYVNLGRQPSVTISNLCAHKVVVCRDRESIGLNIASCNFFNADFDGDTMVIFIIINTLARFELMEMCNVLNFEISPQAHSCTLGCAQDSIIGTALLTKDNVKINKFRYYNILYDAFNLATKLPNSDELSEIYTGRELVSNMMPAITLEGTKPTFYRPQFAQFFNYNKNDIVTKIVNGKLVSGVIDKATAGAGVVGSIFHQVYSKFGPKMTADLVHQFLRTANNFLGYKGFTIGPREVLLKQETSYQISQVIKAMLERCKLVQEKANNGTLIAPVGVTVEDWYYTNLMAELSPGDEFAKIILGNSDFDRDSMKQLIAYGSKGDLSNLISIAGSVGFQTKTTGPIAKNCGSGRTSVYFQTGDISPEALGYVPDSIMKGLSPETYEHVCKSNRDAEILKALGVSESGAENRIGVKNLEEYITNIRRSVAKNRGTLLLQNLYSYSGFDPRSIELVKFPHVKLDAEGLAKYNRSSDFKESSKEHAILLDEFTEIQEDVAFYRNLQFHLQSYSPIAQFTDAYNLPLNISNIIEDVVGEYDKSSKAYTPIDPKQLRDRVKKLIDDLPYIHYNKYMKQKRMPLPDYVKISMTFINIMIRAHLNYHNLTTKKIDMIKLMIICDRIETKLINSLIQYGTPIGILAAQAISQPLTQFLLDSKHRSATSGSKTDTLDRVKEILGAVSTEKMYSASMCIKVLPKYENDKLKVTELANKIKMIKFTSLVSHYVICIEKFGEPKASRYVHEKEMIQKFVKNNPSVKPADLLNYCIRYTIDINEMISKSFSLQDIIIKLKQEYPELYIVHSDEITNSNIILRCYIRATLFKTTSKAKPRNLNDRIVDFNNILLDTVIRGVNNIKNAEVKEISISYQDEKQGISNKKIYHIVTDGTNLSDIMKLPYVDKYRTQSDSILETEKMYGIEASKDKIVYELKTTYDKYSFCHTLVYACVMTETGDVTNIKYTGINMRDKDNILLRMGLYSTNKAMVEGALNNVVSPIEGITPALICGMPPQIGTFSFDVQIDEEFNRKQQTKIMEAIDEI